MTLWRGGFRRLLATRMLSQLGDGIFQAGLAWLVLLSPDAQQTAGAFVGVLALLLLPFSIVAPFLSLVLDRWPRRTILVIGQLLRTAIVVAVGATALLSGERATWGVYVLVLGGLGLDRLLLAALSASVPHVVDDDHLVAANAIAPTAGTISNGLGLAVGGLVIALAGRSTAALGVSVLLYLTAAWVASGFAVLALGPDRGTRPPHWRDAVLDLREAVVHLASRRRAATALGWFGLFRVGFGAWTLVAFLRTSGQQDNGAALAVGIAAGIGYGAAALAAPFGARVLGMARWVLVLAMLCIAAVACALVLATVGPVPHLAPWLVEAFAFGIVGQTAKITVDTTVQRHVGEGFLGRVFTIYDVLFNVTYVAGAALVLGLV